MSSRAYGVLGANSPPDPAGTSLWPGLHFDTQYSPAEGVSKAASQFGVAVTRCLPEDLQQKQGFHRFLATAEFSILLEIP